ncbi:MAG: exopolysaccharide biosynthesis polyprenyl glycosylphosphotransferase, partial [Pseudomonadota bacterium]|nr:exopolysaccharide biosynthesis polyprenyl glycosylphosphotransferase [Pseudomonadota bacterium]
MAALLGGYLCAVVYSAVFPTHPMMQAFFGNAGRLALVGALLAPFVLYEKAGEAHQVGSVVRVVSHLAPRMLSLLAILLATAFLTRTMDDLPRIWVCMWTLSIGASAVLGRVFLSNNVQRLERAGVLRDRIAIVGSGRAAEILQRDLARAGGRATEIVGVFDDGVLAEGAGNSRTLETLIEIGKREALDLILVTPSFAEARQEADDRLARIVRELKALDVQVAFCPDMGGIELHGRSLDCLGDIPFVILTNRAIRRWGLVLKKFEDRLLGLLLLIALLPLMGMISLAVWLDGPGPLIFRQHRHGWNNSEFEVFKFRTMKWEPHGPASQLRQTRRNDSRVTRVGAFLRRTSLDELPQLFNVLRGDMSLVGPRPHPVVMRTEERLCHEIVADYAHRHRVKPGITGWAQIHGCRG